MPPPTLPPPILDAPLYRESSSLFANPIVRAVIPLSLLTTTLILGAIAVAHAPSRAPLLTIWLAIAALELGIVALFRLTVTLTDRRLTVRFHPFITRRIDLADIESAEAITYNPIADAGGWGLRRSKRFGLILTIAGDRAVHITAGPTRLLVGSKDPDALAEAIRAAAGLSR